MHILPQLRELEHRFGDALLVIGVHAGKFPAERITANIRQAVMRLEIDHPVVNDRQFHIWRAHAVRAWPTIVLIDPFGRQVGARPGEVSADFLTPILGNVLRRAEEAGPLERRPLPLRPERRMEPDRALAFPAGVLAAEDGHLFIADTNHHRVIWARVEEDGRRAEVLAVIGSGEAGLRDGSFHHAAFRRPHGLALTGDQLFVADTDNHAVRRVDLSARTVHTIAGTGKQAGFRAGGGPARRTTLNSPWGLTVHTGALYIAMAGAHQIWRLELAAEEVHPFAGSGAEGIVDGPAATAALAQPSAIIGGSQTLYFVDAESSAVRWLDPESGRVGTLAGTGLFDFGDQDGIGEEARLQHPQGIAWHAGRLYVTDTYNNTVRLVDPGTRRVETLRSTQEEGLYEPGGISSAGGRLYIADTNHHRICTVDLVSGRLETLEIVGL